LFTVVIAEKDYIASIQEYKVFLKPFIDDSKVAFCEWRPDEHILSDMLPHLHDTVARHQEWRAIVVCDESGLYRKNPFNAVTFKTPVMDTELAKKDYERAQKEYLQRLQFAKFRAFDEAARKPLTRLMTWLCEAPLITKGKNNYAAEDPEFAEYVAESTRKQEIREQIIAGEERGIPLPTEVICVAKRTYTEQEYDINTSWDSHDDIQYSRFYDWNLYFDKMRYLVFDILPKTHANYEFDSIRFLYAMMILANNDTPAGVLKPNRVFCLNCENDEAVIDRLLSLYDAKLAQTSTVLSSRIAQIEQTEKQRLSDHEARQIFCADIHVPVTLSHDIDRNDLFAKPNELGLSTDCPKDEYAHWDGAYLTSRKTLLKLLKQPRRALKRAASDLRRLNKVNLDRAGALNEFQAEDVLEYTNEEELSMVSTITPNLFDTEEYDKQMAEHCKQIHRKIQTRMTRKTTVILGLVTLAVYLVGFLPLLFSNLSDEDTLLTSLIVMGSAVGLLALVCFICLLFLRGALRALYRSFNGLMDGINRNIDASTAQFSCYLSHACNVMRGFSVLNFRAQTEDPDTMRIRVLKKHMADIQRTREELHAVFGHYMTGEVADGVTVEAYPYDFSRPVDFPYPIPYSNGMKSQIEFMQSGSKVQIPVDFVKRITVRREELYD